MIVDHHLHKLRGIYVIAQASLSIVAAPHIEIFAANTMTARNLSHRNTWLTRFLDNP